MKGIPIKCFPILDINQELKKNLHDSISNLILKSKLKVPILGVKRETGSTQWHNENFLPLVFLGGSHGLISLQQ